jgi:hypothetical protein
MDLECQEGKVMFAVGMACAALRKEMANLVRVDWLPEQAGFTNVAGEGRLICIIPCAPESDITEVGICLSIHNERWFPVTATVQSSTDRRTFLFKNSSMDGSIICLEPVDPASEFDRFDLGLSLVCPHPPGHCID